MFWGLVAPFVGVLLIYMNETTFIKDRSSIDLVRAEAELASCECSPALEGRLVFASCGVSHMPKLTDAPNFQDIKQLFKDGGFRGTDLIVELGIYQYVQIQSDNGSMHFEPYFTSPQPDYAEWGYPNRGAMPRNFPFGIHVVASTGSVWMGDKSRGYALRSNEQKQIFGNPDVLLFKQDHQPLGRTFFVDDVLTADNVFVNGNTLQTYPTEEGPVIGDVIATFKPVQPKWGVGVLAKQVDSSFRSSVGTESVEFGFEDRNLDVKFIGKGDVVPYPSNTNQRQPQCAFEPYPNPNGHDIDWLLDGTFSDLDESSTRSILYNFGSGRFSALCLFEILKCPVGPSEL